MVEPVPRAVLRTRTDVATWSLPGPTLQLPALHLLPERDVPPAPPSSLSARYFPLLAPRPRAHSETETRPSASQGGRPRRGGLRRPGSGAWQEGGFAWREEHGFCPAGKAPMLQQEGAESTRGKTRRFGVPHVWDSVATGSDPACTGGPSAGHHPRGLGLLHGAP